MLNVFRSWIEQYFSNEEAPLPGMTTWIILITLGPIIVIAIAIATAWPKAETTYLPQ